VIEVEDLWKRLTSRKFLLTVAGIAGFILLGISGSVAWPEALDGIKALILAYLAVEGFGDALGKYSYFRNKK